MSDQRPNRFNVLLDEAHAAKLYGLAERTCVSPGRLARSLLSTALDQEAPEAASVTALLDAIPGAYDSALEGHATSTLVGSPRSKICDRWREKAGALGRRRNRDARVSGALF